MLHSDTRILTTHTGSLPRPRHLTELYAARARGEAIDAAELAAEGRAAVAHVVAKQLEAGIDIGNNGEQQREAFFLYVRHRMSGFGGSWRRCWRGARRSAIMSRPRRWGRCAMSTTANS